MKSSILMVRILLVPLIGFLLGECISRTPCQDDVSVGKQLPIDGVWKASITDSRSSNDFYYKIEGGRMVLAAVKGPDSLAHSEEIGKLFFCDIAFMEKNKYSCKIFSIYGTPSINGFLEVVDGKIFVSPRNPILVQELSEISLTHEELYKSYHAK